MPIKAPQVTEEFILAAQEIVGSSFVSSKNLDRLNYSRDASFKAAIQAKYKKVEFVPDIIVWPQEVAQVQGLIKLARKHKVPVVPYGAGSGVCGGTIPVQGGMVIDVKRMNQFIRLDRENLLVQVEAGMMGMHLEDRLLRQGYTLGHYPSSIICASVGGYLAARSAGQQSSRYGKIEDRVRSLEMVDGRGRVIQTHDIKTTPGLDFNQMIMGSEGTFGIITKTTLKIFPRPPERSFSSWKFPDMKTAMEAMRQVMQSGLKPSVMRLYDELDTLLLLSIREKEDDLVPGRLDPLVQKLQGLTLRSVLSFPQLLQNIMGLIPSGCLVVIVHEGHPRLIKEEKKIIKEIAKNLGAKDEGKDPAEHWFEHRYSVSFKASPLMASGLFTDTIEMATTWDNLHNLYKGMVKALTPYALVMAHLSHVYTDGGALYFTFVAPMKGLKKSEKLFDQIWDKALKTGQEYGAVISHHHGIGRLKAKAMTDEWGKGALIYQKLKRFFDPDGMMNPGKLWM